MSTKPTLYYSPASPPSRAVLLVAKAINLELDLKFVDTIKREQLEPWYLAINPQHTVPTLVETDGRRLWDSHAICTYLIDRYGTSGNGDDDDHPLYPRADPFTRARIDQRLHFEGTVLFAIAHEIGHSIFFARAAQASAGQLAAARAGYDLLETFLETDAYLAGNTLTVADLSTVTTLTQLSTQAPLDADRHGNVLAWIGRVERAVPYFNELNTVYVEKSEKFLEELKERNRKAAQWM